MIAAVMLMSVVLVGPLCLVAYTLATYALPLMLGFAAARFAYHTGSGLIGASFIGVISATPRSACLRFCLPRCGRRSCVLLWHWVLPCLPSSPVTRWSMA